MAEPEAAEAAADPTPARSAKASPSPTKMDKTVVVAVVDRVRHPRYRRRCSAPTHLYAHDEANDVREGDRVRIAARPGPMSKPEALARRRSARAGR